MSSRPEAGSPCAHLHGFAAEPLLGGSRLPCGQLASRVQSRQKQRLGDIRVKLQ
jgi:hypothetical protein